MTFIQSIKICFSKYADSTGRASLGEFGNFILFCWIVGICTMILDTTLFLECNLLFLGCFNFHAATILGLFVLFYPVHSVCNRRLNDVGIKSRKTEFGRFWLWLDKLCPWLISLQFLLFIIMLIEIGQPTMLFDYSSDAFYYALILSVINIYLIGKLLVTAGDPNTNLHGEPLG